MSSNHDQEQHIVEDGPQMRSVAMMAPPAVPMMPMRSAIVKQPLAAPTRLKAPAKPISSVWSVPTAPSLPSLYFLERTHAHVQATSQQVATRIADALYRESIATRFTDEASLSATTVNHVQFEVRLWASPDATTVVEVQRVDGCARGFQIAAKAVLRAAQAMESYPPSPRTLRPVPDAVRQEAMEVSNSCTQEGIDIALDMMKQDRPEMAVMGMESLAQITGSKQCQVYSAKHILNGELGLDIISIIERPIDESTMEHEVIQQRMLRCHSLSALYNTLTALESCGEIEDTLQARPELTRSSLLLALVGLLETHHQCPHNACKATKILQILIAAGPPCCKTRAANLSSAIDSALSCRHYNLERECHKLQKQL